MAVRTAKTNGAFCQDVEAFSYHSSEGEDSIPTVEEQSPPPPPPLSEKTKKRKAKRMDSVKSERPDSSKSQPRNAWASQEIQVDKPKPMSIQNGGSDDEDTQQETQLAESTMKELLLLFDKTFASKTSELERLQVDRDKQEEQYARYKDSADERKREMHRLVDECCADFNRELDAKKAASTAALEASLDLLRGVVEDMRKIAKKKDKLTEKHVKSLKQHFARWEKSCKSVSNTACSALSVSQPELSAESVSELFGRVNSAASSVCSSSASTPKKHGGESNPDKSNTQLNKALSLITQFSSIRRKDKRACGITDITLSSSGDVFLVDKINKSLKIFDMGGAYKNSTSKGVVKKPMRVSYLPCNDKLILTDEGKNELILYATDLSFHKKLLALQFPVSHDYFGENMIAVLEFNSKSIMIYDLSGRLVNMFPTKMECPAYIACTPGKKIAVTDWKTGLFKIFNSSGVEIFTLQPGATGQTAMEEPYGVCCDLKGNIFVADKKRSTIGVFAESGEVKHVFTNERDNIGQPFALACNSTGILAVAEYSGAVRIFRYSMDGLDWKRGGHS